MARIKQKKIKWVRLPVLCPVDERDDYRLDIDGAVTLVIDGTVVIHNRWFRGSRWFGWSPADRIDLAFPGGHAYRDKGSNRLVIRTAGPDHQSLVYEYQGLGLFSPAVWYQLHSRVA